MVRSGLTRQSNSYRACRPEISKDGWRMFGGWLPEARMAVSSGFGHQGRTASRMPLTEKMAFE